MVCLGWDVVVGLGLCFAAGWVFAACFEFLLDDYSPSNSYFWPIFVARSKLLLEVSKCQVYFLIKRPIFVARSKLLLEVSRSVFLIKSLS